MIALLRPWLVSSLTLLLAACAGSPKSDQASQPMELVDAAVVSTVQPGFVLPADATIAWGQDMRLVAEQADESLLQLVLAMKNMIDSGFAQRGLYIASNDQPHSFELVAVVVVGQPEGDQPLVRMLNLNTLAASWDGHDSGTLGIALRRTGTNRNLWSSAIRLQIDADSSLSERQRRSQAAVAVLLQRLPLQ